MSQPPPEIKIVFCPVCGRTDRYSGLKAGRKHYTRGKLCSGEPAPVTYVPKEDS